jgi:hypothetical protein
MDGKHFSLITIAMIILLGIVGLGFMQMNTNNTLSTIANRLMVVEKHVQQETCKNNVYHRNNGSRRSLQRGL